MSATPFRPEPGINGRSLHSNYKQLVVEVKARTEVGQVSRRPATTDGQIKMADSYSGWSDFGLKWVRLTPDGKIRAFFRSHFEPKCTEIWSEKSPDLSHLGSNRPKFGPKSDITAGSEGQLKMADIIFVIVHTSAHTIGDILFLIANSEHIVTHTSTCEGQPWRVMCLFV